MEATLVIGDTHCPAMLRSKRKNYIDHLLMVYEKYECSHVVHIGDLVDNHALSYHNPKAPRLKDPIKEYEKALFQIRELTSAFPENVDLMLGNHDALPWRLARDLSIPDDMLKDFAAMFELPDGWTVHERFSQLVRHGVIYQHGDRGRNSALLNSQAEFVPVVQGHHHQKCGVTHYSNRKQRTWAVQTGCGVDEKHLSQSYGVKYNGRPVHACAVVFGNHSAVVEPMP